MPRFVLPLAVLGALVAAAPAAAAAGTLLDPVGASVRVAKAVEQSCQSPRTRRGTATWSYTPRIGGHLTVRSAGRGDWDLALRDRATGQLLAVSQAFGAREVLQTWVLPGRPLRVVACRRSGRATTLKLSAQLFAAEAPKAGAPASLVRVTGLDRDGYERLNALGVDVTHEAHDGHADVVASAGDRVKLTKAGFAYTVRTPDLDAAQIATQKADARYRARVGRSPLPSGRTSYRTYDGIQAELKALVEKNPGVVRAIKLPQSSFQGRELSGIEIAENVGAADGRPQFLFVAVHHAREWPAAETAMEFAHELVSKRGKDARVDGVLRSTRTVIVPLINPDGYISSRTTSLVDPSHNLYENGIDVPMPLFGNMNTFEAVMPPGGLLSFRRKNCNGAIPSGAVPCELQYGIDPNRNYGEGWGGPGSSPDPTSQSFRGPGPWSEPETQAVHEWSQTHNVTTLITLHNVAAMVLRPPGTKAGGLAPDETELKRVGDAMAAATGYKSLYGYQLYDTSGTTEDWNYAAAGTFGFTIEMGPQDGEFHMPYEIGVVQEWEGMRQALLIAAEDAADPAHHSVIAGRAPAGRTLRLHKDFTTATRETCSMAITGQPFNTGLQACVGETLPAQEVPDKLDYTTTVPASGVFDWHVTPSTRPFVAKKGGTESWTLTCEDRGKVIESRSITIGRGERIGIDVPCGGTLPAATPPKPAGKPRPKAKSKRLKVCAKARKAKGKQKRKLQRKCRAAIKRAARRRRQ